MNVLFINDSATDSNWGDRAAAISLMAMIRHRGGQITRVITLESLWHSEFVERPFEPPSAEVPDISAREQVKSLIPPIVLRARRRVLRLDEDGPDQLIPRRWEDFDAAADNVSREKKYGWPVVLRAIRDADVAVIHGSSLHGDIVVSRTELFLAFLIKTRFGKRVAIVNHTADLGFPPLRHMAERVYPLFDDVVYRDPISAERWAASLGGRFAADTAFWFEPAPRDAWAPIARRPTYFDVWPDTATFDPSEPYLCLGGSSIFHDRKDWASVINGYSLLVEHLRSTYSGAIVLTASAALDQTVFRAVAERFHLPLIGVSTPVQQAVDILGNADAYIGGRWHAGIFAVRGGTPLIALSSQTFKMRALADMTGSSSALFNALDPGRDASSIGRRLSLALAQGSDLRRRLRSWGDRMAENSWDNVAILGRKLVP